MNFFRYLWLACSGFRTYGELLSLPMRRVVGYWVLFSLLVAGVILFNLAAWLRGPVARAVEEAAAELPAFRIRGGEIFSAAPQPAVCNTNRFPIILDLDGQLAAAQSLHPSGLLIRRHELVLWTPDSHPPATPLAGWPDGEVNRDYLLGLVKEARHTLPALLPVFWILVVAAGMAQAALLSGLAALFERSMEPRFDFGQLFRIALFALTPGSVILSVYASLGFWDISYGLIHFGCHGFFLVMAAAACRIKPPGSADIPVSDEGEG